MKSLKNHWKRTKKTGKLFLSKSRRQTLFFSMSYIGRSPIKVGIRFKRKVSAFRIFCPIQNSLRSDEVMSTWKKIHNAFFRKIFFEIFEKYFSDFRKIEKSTFEFWKIFLRDFEKTHFLEFWKIIFEFWRKKSFFWKIWEKKKWKQVKISKLPRFQCRINSSI